MLIRLYVKDKESAVVKGMMRGLDDMLKIPGDEVNYEWWDYEDIAQSFPYNDDGSIAIDKMIDELNREKMAIFRGDLNDKYHFDVIITDKKLKPMSYNFVFGRSNALLPAGLGENVPYIPLMGHLVTSSYNLDSYDKEREFLRGYLVMFHEVAHWYNMDHNGPCKDVCAFGPGEGGLEDLDKAVDKWIDTREIPLCPRHQEFLGKLFHIRK